MSAVARAIPSPPGGRWDGARLTRSVCWPVHSGRACPRFRGTRNHPGQSKVTLPRLAVSFWIAAGPWFVPVQQAASPPDFAGSIFPRLEAHNCRACHNASGVASETRLHFPDSSAPATVIEQFGRSLTTLVDRQNPSRSLLILKPTNAVPHTGGPLVAEGSEDERLLTDWVEYLASLDESEDLQKGPSARSVPEPLRRLTHAEYDNTVFHLLGDRTKPSRNFPPEDFVNGYTNQSSAQAINSALADAYSTAAEKLAGNAFRYGDENGLIPCEPVGAADRSCAESFVREFGLRAYRRPLHQAEVTALWNLLISWALKSDSFTEGAATVVEAILQSPEFLYVAPDGVDGPSRQYDIASRLSYALWDSPPDKQLLVLAAEGQLASPEAVERTARSMLDHPAARDAFDRFFAQWMRFDRLLNAVKDRNRYRNYSREVAESMTEESLRLFRHLVWNDIDFREFFSADYTFVDDFLTVIYAMPDPEEPFGLMRYPANSMRGGILGHGTYLAQTGKPINTSPTERGLFVREHFLCQSIPPPPPGVDASLPPLKLGDRPMTVRETMTQLHASHEACASCHRLVDPIGFGFEHFDTIGAFRETEPVHVDPTPQQKERGMETETHQLPIDPSGLIAGIANSEFSSPREAGLVLAESKACHKCLVKQVFRYIFGRHETGDDADLIAGAYNRFQRSGFQFRELVLGLVVSREYLRTDWEE